MIISEAQRVWRSGRSPATRVATQTAVRPGQAAASLRRRTLKAGFLILAQQILSAAMRLGGSLILTRMLLPEAFGLMSVVYVLTTGLGLLSDLGLTQNVLVNSAGEDPRFLRTAWTLQALRSFVMCVASLICTALILLMVDSGLVRPDTVYNSDELPPILCTFAILMLVSGLESINLKRCQRQLQVGWVTGLELGSQAIGLVAMIAFAMVYHSVWALVLGAGVSGVAKTLGSFIVLPGISVRFCWHRPSVGNLLRFGKWILISSALTFFVQSGDRLIMGGLVDAATLGTYSIAVIILGMVQTLYLVIVSNVMLPALSEASRDSEIRARALLSKFQIQVDLFLFGSSGILYVAGPSIVALLYDQRYSGAGPLLSILSLGLIGLRFSPLEQFCMAQNKVHNFAIWNAARAAMMAAGLPAGFAVSGFNGAVVAVVLTQFAAWPLAFHFRMRNGLVIWGREIVGAPAFAIGTLLGAVVSHGLDIATYALRH